MDSRRLLIPACAGLILAGCAVSPETRSGLPLSSGAPDAATAAAESMTDEPSEQLLATPTDGATPYLSVVAEAPEREAPAPTAVTGRRAIAAANADARAASRSDAFVGGVQVFAWAPGGVYEIWAAPLRVTTLTLGPGETLVAKAAGDTVRWQIGETSSGEGAARRIHVLIKPLQRGLETNLVLTTNRRVYLLELKSGDADGFNAAVAWDEGPDVVNPSPEPASANAAIGLPDPVVAPEGPLDARYRVQPLGRRPRWTPASVFNDGRRTFIAFPPEIQIDEAPALFVVAPGGETQLVNYRQAGGLLIVDRLFDEAELRLGDRRPQRVRIRRATGADR